MSAVAERATPALIDTLGWVSTAALAELLGRQDARSALGWCKRHKIPVARDGKWNFVRIADVRAALERLALGGESEEETVLRQAVEAELRG